MNIRDIQPHAKQAIDDEGNPVIQIPLEIWQQFTGEQPVSQIEQIDALLNEGEQQPGDDMPDDWWDEFAVFLNENRLTLCRR